MLLTFRIARGNFGELVNEMVCCIPYSCILVNKISIRIKRRRGQLTHEGYEQYSILKDAIFSARTVRHALYVGGLLDDGVPR